MAVVISDFEVVPEQPAPPQPGPAPADQNPPTAPSAEEIGHLVRRQLERQARVWAH